MRIQESELLELGAREEVIDAARAGLAELEAAYQLAKAGYREEEVRAGRDRVSAAEAALRALETRIGELSITAPVDGRIRALDLDPGDLVAANSPALTLTQDDRLWVRAYVPESRLTVAPDRECTVTVDAYPERTFRARITYVSPSAEFTPRNVQTPEERSKQVFRIKADLLDGLDTLRAGMGADVHFDEDPRP
ncbi:MAG: HlyD family efflux transporter periplasmic adaptor subunit [Planctomycetes bacterium]|nr:HlyD family efflux transporter periplasmic adaptor subunit [Planctomycetota bacterium]